MIYTVGETYYFTFDEVTDDLIVEVLYGSPSDAFLYILILKRGKKEKKNYENNPILGWSRSTSCAARTRLRERCDLNGQKSYSHHDKTKSTGN